MGHQKRLRSGSGRSAMKETEIRPDELMQGQRAAFENDVARLISFRHDFVEVPCPSCASQQEEALFEKFDLTYVRCKLCETVYVNPRPTPEILEHFYAVSENYEYWNEHIFPASEGARREKIFKPRARRVAEICDRLGVASSTAVDVGAGFGTFCEELKVLGIFERVVAVEPTPSLAQSCRDRGVEVIESPIEKVDLGYLDCSIISAFEVIEHLFSPRSFVQACVRHLSVGGLAIFTCPNVKGFDLMVLGSLSGAFDIEHLNYFTPKSLVALMEASGLEIVEVSTPGELDAELVRKQAVSGALDLSGNPFLKEILIERWAELGAPFQGFLADHGLSSHLWVVGRKL